MKFREDFVTNSSSASYIICFARVADMDKAKAIIDKYELDILNADDVKNEMRWGELGSDLAAIYGAGKILEAHPDDKYIIIEDSLEGFEDEDGYAEYFYDFGMNEAIDNITESNGFANINVAQGEGRDG